MITRVQIKNFRSLADVDIELGPLTVLVGRNGVGKSTLVDALRFVCDALRTNLENAISIRRGLGALRRWTPDEQPEIEIALSATFEQTSGLPSWTEYSFALASLARGGYHVSREKWCSGKSASAIDEAETIETRDGKWVKPPTYLEGHYSPPIDRKDLIIPNYSGSLLSHLFLEALIDSSFYDVPPNALRPPQQPATEEWLAESGENLASVLSRLCRNEAAKRKILALLGQVTEGVSDIRVQPVGGFLVTELEHADVVTSAKRNGASAWFPLNQESDGTLRFLAMLVALSRDPEVGLRLLAFEEPETSLHPGALAIISDELRAAAYQHQILITTQSPDLISRFNADELRVVERVGGVTQIGPVDEVQREAITEQLFSAGDLLRIEGLRREPVAAAGGRRA